MVTAVLKVDAVSCSCLLVQSASLPVGQHIVLDMLSSASPPQTLCFSQEEALLRKPCEKKIKKSTTAL